MAELLMWYKPCKMAYALGFEENGLVAVGASGASDLAPEP